MRRLLLLLTLPLAGWGAESPAKPPPSDPFWQQTALDAVIAPAGFDRQLLAAAIFHETNRVRRELRLPPFQSWPKLDAAADLEANVGRVYRPPSHYNPFPQIGTPMERVKYVGLNPGAVAENIAALSIYDVDPALGVGLVNEGGRRRLVNPLTRAELTPATYRRFALLVVQAWMASPGHRANIVNPTLRCLACSVQPTISTNGVDNLFCVQVFFTPGD